MDLHFLYFPTSLQVKRLAPKGQKMRMDHPFILGFCQNVILYIVFTRFVQLLGKQTTFFNELYFNSFVYPRFKYGRPHIIIIST